MTVVVMTGATASGKSTAAQWLSERLPSTVSFHSARIREELELMPEDLDDEYAFDLGDDVFVEEVSTHVYDEMRERAAEALEHRENVILDGSHRLRAQREASYRLGREHDEPIVVVRCSCDDTAEVRHRLAERRDDDDALAEATEFETYRSTVEAADPVSDDPAVVKRCVSLVDYNTAEQAVSVVTNTEESDEAERIASALQELAMEYEGNGERDAAKRKDGQR